MILLLDTSTPLCRLVLVEGATRHESSWEANRELAKGLLGYIERELQQQGKTFADLTALGTFVGPGSFTGLRIGLSVLNTLSDALNIPIVGATGDAWRADALTRIERGDNDRIVLPEYGGDAHITKPRK